MRKFVLIQAVPAPGFNHHGEAHRLWPAGGPVKVEILEQEADPPKVEVKRRNPDGTERVELEPDPGCIGQISYRALVANPRIRILSDGKSVETAELTAAHDQAAKLGVQVVELRGQVVELETENDTLKARIAELTGGAPVVVTPAVEPVIPVEPVVPEAEVKNEQPPAKAAEAGRTRPRR